MSHLVGKSEDGFSCVAAHMIMTVSSLPERGNASKNKTLSYESSYNETIECNKQNQKVIFHSPRAQAAIVFSQVRLQPYSKFVRLDNGKGTCKIWIDRLV